MLAGGGVQFVVGGVLAYLSESEDEDAARTAELVRAAGQRCVTIRGDLAIEDNCQRAVEQTVTELGGLDALVNNVATQEPVDDLGELRRGTRAHWR
jgi:NAD(P)-dependent dehydrogenase (short-subunit alcohol dehydrogenase family)